MYAYEYNSSHLISVTPFTANAAAKRYIGDAFGYGPDIVRFAASQGRIGCVASRNLVVVTSDLLGEVRAYDIHGKIQWARRLPAYRAIQMELGSGESYRTRAPDEGFESTSGLFEVANEIWVEIGLVQQRRQHHESFNSFRIVALNAETGTLTRQFSLPGRLVSTHGRRIVVSTSNAQGVYLIAYNVIPLGR